MHRAHLSFIAAINPVAQVQGLFLFSLFHSFRRPPPKLDYSKFSCHNHCSSPDQHLIIDIVFAIQTRYNVISAKNFRLFSPL